ncbi:RluA family pseudouridine synthase [Vibrio salinus]|uniref:RluA family pseudouridine synthase n=1 Tax=Vibrio salinus TaxID=2899784 RepID=UPI001E5151D7|nr:RluA family pseudouridine synthase [Vibrio salinus]MCE0495361.1 pseudouridine synthase [Vibrio salinus]
MPLSLSSYFRRFSHSISGIELPEMFTYPFCYEPHPLCIKAAEQLQEELTRKNLLDAHYKTQSQEEYAGKMFGVLIVKDSNGELGFLAGFSGKLAGSNHYEGFVPPVYDILDHDNVFLKESEHINRLNTLISELSASQEEQQLQTRLERCRKKAEAEIAATQQDMVKTRKARKQARTEAETLPSSERDIIINELARQSIEEKKALAATKQKWQEQITQYSEKLELHLEEISRLKEERKQRSNQLQHSLFSNYKLLNANGQEAILIDLFKDTRSPVPPAGSGECAAPKLLQFAYRHNLLPVTMAEFWWGHSPKSAIRKHRKFYPSCQSKCLPILTHMLQGLTVEPNPLQTAPVSDKDIDIVYQDDAIVVLNKPAEMLSVPGVHIQDSAFHRLKERLKEQLKESNEGPFVIHRLDMSTSGLLVFALTKRANKNLQKQFISRSVEKRYIAELEGLVMDNNGYIRLPLAPDFDDKPRQIVCEKRGKAAETYWEVIRRDKNRTRLYLYPKTGRTHQLRVHCAHYLGLNSPMVGDDLYGDKAKRLHLHAETLTFDHPYTHKRLSFQIDAEF